MIAKKTFMLFLGIVFLYGKTVGFHIQEITPVLRIGMDAVNENEIIGVITDMTISSNRIYVLDNKFSRIQKYDTSGKYLGSIGKRGEGPGEFGTDLKSIVADEEGNLIVGGMRKIYIFEKNGEYIHSFHVNFQMNDLCVDREGNILVLGYYKDKIIHAYNQEGHYLFSFGEPFEASSEFRKYKHHPVVKVPLKIFCTKSNRVCLINPYQYEIHIYQNHQLDGKIKHRSDFFKTAWLMERQSGFIIMSMGYAIFENNDELYVSLFEKEKTELNIYRNHELISSLIIDGRPMTMCPEGYIYSIDNSETPHIVKSVIKLTSHDHHP